MYWGGQVQNAGYLCRRGVFFIEASEVPLLLSLISWLAYRRLKTESPDRTNRKHKCTTNSNNNNFNNQNGYDSYNSNSSDSTYNSGDKYTVPEDRCIFTETSGEVLQV